MGPASVLFNARRVQIWKDRPRILSRQPARATWSAEEGTAKVEAPRLRKYRSRFEADVSGTMCASKRPRSHKMLPRISSTHLQNTPKTGGPAQDRPNLSAATISGSPAAAGAPSSQFVWRSQCWTRGAEALVPKGWRRRNRRGVVSRKHLDWPAPCTCQLCALLLTARVEEANMVAAKHHVALTFSPHASLQYCVCLGNTCNSVRCIALPPFCTRTNAHAASLHETSR
jgi:hypothetical protein